MNKLSVNYLIPLCMGVACLPAWADMGRVYHPYVEQNEREIEYGLTVRDLSGERLLLQRAGFGYTWTDRVFTEAYVLTETLTHEEQQISGYEVEVKLQLTEQGEYWADWGLLFEVATAKDNNAHEVAAGLLWEKELTSRWISTINGFIEYEFGSVIQNEVETALRAQLRYRQSLAFEPAIEIYLDDQDWAAGPAFIGAVRLSKGKQLRWELGLLFGLDKETPENNLRFGLEFEF